MPDKFTYDYNSPSKILEVVEAMQTTERNRATNRALINNLFNGGRPYTAEQEKKLQIQWNVNWGEGTTMLMRANTQVNGALLHKGNYFSAKCMRGPIEKRDEWGQRFTEFIQEPMKRGKSGKKHLFLMKNRNASLTLHGVGPMMWTDDHNWMPRFVPLEDLLIPTDTFLDFTNLTHFAVNLYLTPYELFDMALGEGAQEGWKKSAVKKILTAYKGINSNQHGYDWYNQPEKMAEVWKQNRVAWDNDSVPVIRLISFFYRGVKSTKGGQSWYRKIILREVVQTPSTDALQATKEDEFVFDWDKPFADDIDHILHVQYGDCSIVPPLKYPAVRGLGNALYAVIEAMNRVRCQFAQHVFESFLMYFRITNPAMQDRPKQMQMFPFGVIPDGVSLIPRNERHQIDPGIIDRFMEQNRQLMSENGSSFVQDIDKGQQGNPITATEANIRLQSVNVIVSSMLNMMYTQENFYYEEVVRRFLNTTSADEDVKKFQERCEKAGIPKDLMKPEVWQVDAERVFGGGDQMLAEQEVTKLLQLAPQLDPTAQRIIKRQYVTVITRDPAKGMMLVPENPDEVTDGMRAAEIAFGGLMADGLKRALPEGIEREEYIQTLLQMAEAKMTAITQTDNIGSPQELGGLQAVLQHIAENIQVLEQDQSKKELVKQFGDMLGELGNLLKGFAQRLEEKQANEAGDPEAEAKAQATAQKAAQDYEIKQAKAEQDLQNRQAKFEQEMRHDAEEQRQKMLNEYTLTRASLLMEKTEMMADIENKRKMAAATPAPAAVAK